MKRFFGILFGLTAMVALAVSASAQTPAAAHQVHKVSFAFADPVVVGTQTLPAGKYKLECMMVDGQEVMIFKSDKGVEITRVPCTPKDLTEKVKLSQYSGMQKDGKLVLNSVRIGGEQIEHVLNPAS